MNRFKQTGSMNQLSRYILIMTFLTAGIIAILGTVSFVLQVVILVVMVGLTAFCAWFCLCSLLSTSRQGMGAVRYESAQEAIQARQAIPEAITITEAPAPPCLLSKLRHADRILIIGGMGSGKTTLLKHMIRNSANPVIFDSHATPDSWDCRVVGMGRNYSEIEHELKKIADEMDRRYQQRAGGITAFAPITVIIDELTVLNTFCNLSGLFKSLLCECRKVNIKLIFAGQSDRVKALGIEGAGDLKAGFDAVVYLKIDGRRFYGLVDGIEYMPPPPVIRTGSAPVKPVEPLVISQSAPLNRVETPQEPEPEAERIRRIYADLTAANGGAAPSMNAVCREAFGKKNPQLFYKVKTALSN